MGRFDIFYFKLASVVPASIHNYDLIYVDHSSAARLPLKCWNPPVLILPDALILPLDLPLAAPLLGSFALPTADERADERHEPDRCDAAACRAPEPY